MNVFAITRLYFFMDVRFVPFVVRFSGTAK